MEKLWKSKEGFRDYSVERASISMTFGGGREKLLCYKREYEDLNHEQLLQLLKDAKENNWTTLDLSNCGIEHLPDELWDIPSLKVLYLGNWSQEKNRYNSLDEIPEKIEALQNLEALSFCNIQQIKIPRAIKQLPKLAYIDCFGCRFKKLPYNLLNKNLKAIGIECNTVEQLAQICKIKKLEEIFLTGSPIKELPVEIGDLKYLRGLHLIGTQLETIPESLLNLKRIKKFNIAGTPLSSQIPEEIVNQTAQELISYICKQQRQQGKYFFNESKMIIVGQGNVGKSCLLERIINDNYEEKESTEGIDVKKWEYRRNKKKYRLNIWDFGGQEIYHSTHQFFLTKRSLYVLVWDARAEEEYGRIDYWLKTIESFAEDSPIIVCINKCDKNTTRINRIDYKEYKEKYPQITNVLEISCRDNINISRLRNLIKQQASGLQITKERWLKSWYDIRNEIEIISKSVKYISYDQYIALCEKYCVGIEEAKSLSKYLHDLGVILHYQDDPFLKGIVILSPEWATSAVYKILDSQENILRNRNGVLFLTDLPLIWNETKLYPEDKHVLLLKIMEKFQLCFELSRESYLVAELLENTSINCPIGWNFDNDSCIRVIYDYDFMPAGIMTRFIVRIHSFIAKINGKDMCWRKGVYLEYKKAYARVVMKEAVSERKIEVCVNKQGSFIDGQTLLLIIRNNLNEINNNFNKIHVKEFVPCNCSQNCGYQFEYSTLCTALEKKVETIQCYESFKQVNILKILEGIEIMNSEEVSPYAISIQNNPIISNNVSVKNNLDQTNIITVQEAKKIIMEMQGDIAEIKENLMEEMSEDKKKEVNKNLEKINQDLESITTMNTPEEIVKSGKLNKLRRWLSEFSDENSEIRKSLLGAKNLMLMIIGLMNKFNLFAEKLGITLLPPFAK